MAPASRARKRVHTWAGHNAGQSEGLQRGLSQPAPGGQVAKARIVSYRITMSFLRTLLLPIIAVCLALGLVPAAAQLPGQVPHIRASLLAERPVQPGETVTLAVLMQPDKGWHGYWSNPGDAGLPIALEWTLPSGAGAGQLAFPVPQTLLVQGLMNHVYEHDYAVLVPVTVPKNAAPGSTLPISAKAQWLACTDTICVPEEARLEGTIIVGTGTVGSGAADPRFDGWRAALPAPLDRKGSFAPSANGWRIAVPFPASAAIGAAHFFIQSEGVIDYAARQAFSRSGDTLIIELARAAFPAPEAPGTLAGVLSLGTGPKGESLGGIALSAAPGVVPPAGTPLGQADAPAPFSVVTLALAVLGALAGGLILNIMPCVFPILSLKAMALARAGSHSAKAEGLAYTAGVMLACMALGAAMLALRAAGTQVGWAFQLQDPGVVALLLLLATAITANFAGLYELPGLSLESGPGAAKSGWVGAFGTGLLAAFVATPCTGPFMAAAVGAALILPAWAAMAVFAALGFGLALPFLLLGFIPALRRLIPRPGAWMERFRHAMAIPMGLTVLALGWLAWRLGGPAYAAGAIALAVLVVGLLIAIGRTQRRGVSSARWALPGGVGLAVLALVAVPQLATAGAGGAVEAGLLDAKPFSEAALAEARQAGKPVFAYFTADWCLTCKVNESVAIERETTRDAFRKAGVVVLVGDWTRRDPKITNFLSAQGAAGVPLYLWYPKNAATPQQLPQVLSADLMAGLPGPA